MKRKVECLKKSLFVKLQVQGPNLELTLFSPCHNTKNKNKNKNNNPHQNLSEGGVLEVCNLTHKLLRGFWLVLGG